MTTKIENDDLNFEKDEPILEKTTEEEIKELFKPKPKPTTVQTPSVQQTVQSSCVPSGEQNKTPTLQTTEPKQNPSGGQSVSPSAEKNKDTKILTQEEILATIGKQVNILFEPSDIVEIRAICSAKYLEAVSDKNKFKPRSKWFKANELVKGINDWVSSNVDLIQYPWSLYWGINPRTDIKLRGDKNVVLARCMFCDFDIKDYPNETLQTLAKIIIKRILDLKLPYPSIIGLSGNGYHLYWRLKEPITDMDLWSAYQKKLIKIMGSDGAIWNPERVMRVLGTPNNKVRDAGEGSNCGKFTGLIRVQNDIANIESFGFDKITLDEGEKSPKSKDKADNKKEDTPLKQTVKVGDLVNNTRLSPNQIKLYNSLTKQTVIVETPTGDMILCPFHTDHNPSCSVDMVQKVFKCFGSGCGAKGKIFDYNDDQKFWEEQKKAEPYTDLIDSDIANKVKNFLITPIDLKPLYDSSPKAIQDLTQLLYSINPKTGAPLLYFMSWVIVGGMIGKKVIGRSMGQIHYPNIAFVGMAQTGENKSFLPTIDKILDTLSGEITDCPYALMDNNFTLPFIFSEIGETIPSKEWAKLSEYEKIQKKKELKDKNKLKRARIITSEEIGYDLENIGSSGQAGKEEKGAVLKMTDSGRDISRNTAKDGCRIASDLCVTILGLSQKSTWQKIYDVYEQLDSGFTGRWLYIDGKDYKLEVDKLNISSKAAESKIITILRGLAERFSKMPKMEVSFYENNEPDICAESYAELMTENNYRLYDSLDNYLGLLRSKQIKLAMRFCMIDRLLRMTDGQIDSYVKTEIKGILNDNTNQNEGSEIEVNTLKDKTTYKRYLKTFIDNTIKVFSADAPKSEDDIFMDKIKNVLLKLPKNECTQKHLCTKNWKYANGWKLKVENIKSILDIMEDRGLIHRTSEKYGSVTIVLTQKGLQG